MRVCLWGFERLYVDCSLFQSVTDMSNQVEYSNEYVIGELKKGSHDMFRYVYENYYDSLVRFSFHIVMCEESHDLVHDVFSRLWHNRSLLDERMSLKAYLYSSVRNSSFNSLKHRGVVDRANTKLMQVMQSVDEPDVLNGELTDWLQMTIDTLPSAQRTILRLRLEGYSHKEIADLLGISPRTVGNQITTAYDTIRKRLVVLLPLIVTLIIFGSK